MNKERGSIKCMVIGTGLETLANKLKSLIEIEDIDKVTIDEDTWMNVDLGFIITNDTECDEYKSSLSDADKTVKHIFHIIISSNDAPGAFLRVDPSQFQSDDMYDYIVNAVESIVGTVYNHNYIAIKPYDFFDFLNTGNEAKFIYGEAVGENVWLEATNNAIDKITADSSKVANIIYSVASGRDDISLYEIEAAGKKLVSRFGKDVNVIYGFGLNERLGDAVKVYIWLA